VRGRPGTGIDRESAGNRSHRARRCACPRARCAAVSRGRDAPRPGRARGGAALRDARWPELRSGRERHRGAAPPRALGDAQCDTPHGEHAPALLPARLGLDAAVRAERGRAPLALGAGRDRHDPAGIPRGAEPCLPPGRSVRRGAHVRQSLARLVLPGSSRLLAVRTAQPGVVRGFRVRHGHAGARPAREVGGCRRARAREPLLRDLPRRAGGRLAARSARRPGPRRRGGRIRRRGRPRPDAAGARTGARHRQQGRLPEDAAGLAHRVHPVAPASRRSTAVRRQGGPPVGRPRARGRRRGAARASRKRGRRARAVDRALRRHLRDGRSGRSRPRRARLPRRAQPHRRLDAARHRSRSRLCGERAPRSARSRRSRHPVPRRGGDRDRRPRRSAHRLPRALGPSPAPGERAIVVSPDFNWTPLAYYLPRYPRLGSGDVGVREVDLVGWSTQRLSVKARANLERHGFKLAGARTIQRLRLVRFMAPDARSISGVQLRDSRLGDGSATVLIQTAR
jgi:hypothetical protein